MATVTVVTTANTGNYPMEDWVGAEVLVPTVWFGRVWAKQVGINKQIRGTIDKFVPGKTVKGNRWMALFPPDPAPYEMNLDAVQEYNRRARAHPEINDSVEYSSDVEEEDDDDDDYDEGEDSACGSDSESNSEEEEEEEDNEEDTEQDTQEDGDTQVDEDQEDANPKKSTGRTVLHPNWDVPVVSRHYPPAFSAATGPKVEPPENANMSWYFQRFFSTGMVDIIVPETNRYARQRAASLSGRDTAWTDVTRDDILLFIGLLIGMGIHRLPSVRHYWTDNRLLAVDHIREKMSGARFERILKFLHVNDNETQPDKQSPDFDPLYKISPLSQRLSDCCINEFVPSQHQSIDEQMIGFKGRHPFVHYMPKKPTRHGFKYWARCDASTGFTCEFRFVTRNAKKKEKMIDIVSSVCKHLPRSQGHILYMDNFFSGVSLFEDLEKNGLLACGTVRLNRVGGAKSFALKKNEPRGKNVVFQKENSKVIFVSWKDKSVVNAVSTAHDPLSTSTVLRRLKSGTRVPVDCPSTISEYCKFMGGVDRADNLRTSYNIRLATKKFWHRSFAYCLNTALVNAFILFKLSKIFRSSVSHLNFRLTLFEELTLSFISRKRPCLPLGLSPERRLVDRHFPEIRPQGRCVQCWKTSNTRHRVNTYCPECNVHLCIKKDRSCFTLWHTK
jgi:hypothetical protein